MPPDRVLLNWTDGRHSLGGSVIRPPKDVWLEERSAPAHSSVFGIYQVYDNLIRRALAHAGGKTEKRLDALATIAGGGELYRSVEPWNVPAVTGLRLRAIYEFRNDSHMPSPRLMAHHFARVRMRARARAGVDLTPVLGLPIGADGEGAIEGDVVFATDPQVRLGVVQPWHDAEHSLRDLVRDSLRELVKLAPDLGVSAEDATRAFEEIFADFLPDAAPAGWTFEAPNPIEGGPEEATPFSIRIGATTPGRSLIAVQIEDVAGELGTACSEIVALEVTEQLEIVLLRGPEIGAQPIELVYVRGSLSTEELQAEIDRLWQSLSGDPELAGAVRASGIDVNEMLRDRSPFRVLEGVAGIEPGSILLIAGGVVARDLWREVFLARIRERFGGGAIRGEQPRE